MKNSIKNNGGNMQLIELECPACGGRLEEIDNTHVKCVYCAKVYLISELLKDEEPEVNEPKERRSGAEETANKLKHQPQQKNPSCILVAAQCFLKMYFFILIMVIVMLAFEFAAEALTDGIKNLFSENESEVETTFGTGDFTTANKKNLSSAIWNFDEMTPMEEVFAVMVEALYEKDYYDMTEEDWGNLTSLTIDVINDDEIDVIAIIDNEKKHIICEGSAGEVLTFTWAFRNLEELKVDVWLDARDLTGLSKLTKVSCRSTLAELAEILPYPENITEITGTQINKSTEGLEKFVNLKVLETSIDDCEDLSDLAKLENLEVIDIYSYDDLKSFNVLGKLSNLKSITIDSGRLYSIEFVEELDKLETLIIETGEIKSIEPLRNKQGLKSLKIGVCYTIQDFDVIETLPDLEELNLEGLYVKDSINWENLKNLKSLYLNNAGSTNVIKALSGYEKLENLYLTNLDEDIVENIDVIGRLNNLKSLTLKNGKAFDMSVLSDMPNLEDIYLNNVHEVKGLEKIFNLPQLKKLYIGYSGFEIDFEHISGNSILEKLEICDCTFGQEQLKDNMDIFKGFPALKNVRINGAELNDVEFVRYLPELEQLDIIDNYVSDVTPLNLCKNLKELWCGKNAIVDEPKLNGDVVIHLR